MTCYHPLRAFQLYGEGKAVFNPDFRTYPRMLWREIQLPCGHCIGCRLDYSRDWAIRCVHEAILRPDNMFITLTFNDAALAKHCPNGSLNKRTMQLFWKRFRKMFPKTRIRYFMCGEYGSLHRRPHYHAIVFGFRFSDLRLFSSRRGVSLYTSDTLSRLWSDPETGASLGFSTVGDVSFESCAYVARYVLKKVKGKDSEAFYSERGIIPEYTAMSRRPGIASEWFEKFHSDVFPGDFCLHRVSKTGALMKARPPRYYDKIYDMIEPDVMRNIKANRKSRAVEHNVKDGSEERLAVREEVKRSQVSRLFRPLEAV